MWRIRLYVSRLLLASWLAVTFGMVALVTILDSVANASEIAANPEGGGPMRYMLLRSPVIFDQVYLFTLMVALLLTFVALIRRNELVALLGVGFSVPAQIRLLAPVVVLIAVASAVFIDHAVPPAVRDLSAWGVGEYEGGNLSEEEPLWLNDDGLFVRIAGQVGETGLRGLTFFNRNEEGHVRAVTWATRALHDGETGWALGGVQTVPVAGETVEPMTVWRTTQSPEMIARLAAEPRSLSVRDLREFARLRGSGSRPSAAYRVWHLGRIALPLTSLALLFLAAPLMQRVGRGANGTIAMIFGAIIGFLFLIFDGITRTMGAAGALSPWIAGLAPTVILALVGMYLWLRQEAMR